jgi:hypothetical protein
MWNQFEQSRKNVEEAEISAERERQMIATGGMATTDHANENRAKKRKTEANKSSSSSKTEFTDTTSLFARYLNYSNKNIFKQTKTKQNTKITNNKRTNPTNTQTKNESNAICFTLQKILDGTVK